MPAIAPHTPGLLDRAASQYTVSDSQYQPSADVAKPVDPLAGGSDPAASIDGAAARSTADRSSTPVALNAPLSVWSLDNSFMPDIGDVGRPDCVGPVRAVNSSFTPLAAELNLQTSPSRSSDTRITSVDTGAVQAWSQDSPSAKPIRTRVQSTAVKPQRSGGGRGH